VIGWFPDYLGSPLTAGSAAELGAGPLPGSLAPHLIEAVIASVLIVVGAGATYLVWRSPPSLSPVRTYSRVAVAMRRGLYIDDVQDALIVRPYRGLATAVSLLDEAGVDGLVDGAAEATSVMSRGLSRAHPRLPNLAVTGLILSTTILLAILAFLS
jgi:NADH-quinone oxidoreductase subunit L